MQERLITHEINDEYPDEFAELLKNSKELKLTEDSKFEGLTTEDAAPDAFAPSYIQLRRRLNKALEEARDVRKELAELLGSRSRTCSSKAASVIACVAINERYPAEDPDDELNQKALFSVKAGRLWTDYLPEALAEIESQIDILQKGMSSLHILDQFDRPTLREWSKLQAPALARAINAPCLRDLPGRDCPVT